MHMRARVHGEITLSANKKLATFEAAVRPTVGYMFESLVDDPLNRLPDGQPTVDGLTALGNAMAVDPTPAESNIPAAYTYFGQFIDHDITKTAFDPTLVGPLGQDPIEDSSIKPLDKSQAKQLVSNTRSLTFDLDSLYGGLAQQATNPDGTMRLSQVSKAPFGTIPTADKDHDLPRRPLINNPQSEAEKEADRQALIGDPRNDENLIVAQMHVAFIRAHNVLVERGLSGSAAQTALRRRYQWAVLHDFLPRICEKATFDDLIANGPRFWKPQAEADLFMPLEHSVAAYRFGHSMIRGDYHHNSTFNPADFTRFFTFTALSGDLAPTGGQNTESETLPDNWIIDWSKFFSSEKHPTSENPARRIDTHLTPELGNLRDFQGSPFKSLMARLATRNLLRGYLLGLPTGQAVAKFLGIPEIDSQTLLATIPTQLQDIIAAAGLDKRTPLWYYVLAEAGNPAGPNGNHLGRVGSRIVSETIWNAIRFSEDSVLTAPPSAAEIATGEFDLKGIIRMGLDKDLPGLPA
jgi:hypothetical protein